MMFKVGDKVRCIKDDEWITTGHIYIVTNVNEGVNKGAIWVKSDSPDLISALWYPAELFELVKETFKVGDKVTPYQNCYGLTIGKTYTVLKTDYEGKSPIIILTSDKGNNDAWYANRFNLVEKVETMTIEQAKELLIKAGYTVVAPPKQYDLEMSNGQITKMALGATNDRLYMNGRNYTKQDAITLIEHMQKLMDQMV